MLARRDTSREDVAVNADRRTRVATAADAAIVVEILVQAFYEDPLWSWVFPDPTRRRDHHRALWTLCVEGALRYPWVWLAEGDEAASVWIPPGGTELSEEQAATLEPMLRDVSGPAAGVALDVFAALDAAHPSDPPHYYLSLLGTDPAFRGRGVGLALLAGNLSRIDELQVPAYLESSNPANVALYARHGFVPRDTIRIPDGPEITTMWRDARPGAR